ncbi:hypothetical protein BaRGS_00006324 [Batillaria attramentaria]|uniref:Uncharacterized protein n=1 Tax=Batillaria attramentaria TaxID=370345 RepID=A0ABD0LT44_9CAEN
MLVKLNKPTHTSIQILERVFRTTTWASVFRHVSSFEQFYGTAEVGLLAFYRQVCFSQWTSGRNSGAPEQVCTSICWVELICVLVDELRTADEFRIDN